MLKPRKVQRCTVKNSGKKKNTHMQVHAAMKHTNINYDSFSELWFTLYHNVMSRSFLRHT